VDCNCAFHFVLSSYERPTKSVGRAPFFPTSGGTRAHFCKILDSTLQHKQHILEQRSAARSESDDAFIQLMDEADSFRLTHCDSQTASDVKEKQP
jgi:hypothetical protein